MLLPFVFVAVGITTLISVVPKGVPLLLLFSFGRCYCQDGWWYCHVYDWQMLLPCGRCCCLVADRMPTMGVDGRCVARVADGLATGSMF